MLLLLLIMLLLLMLLHAPWLAMCTKPSWIFIAVAAHSRTNLISMPR